MSEITTGEAMARNANVVEAVALNDTIDKRNEAAKLTDKSRVKDLNTVDAEAKIKEITTDRNIRKNLVDLVKLCDGGAGLSATEKQKMIASFSADLGTIKLFQALQGLQPGRFGILGDPTDAACLGYINELLNNPDFTKLVKEKISGVLNTEKLDDAEITKLEKDKSDIESELTKKEAGDTKNTTEITSIDAEIAEYNTKEDPNSPTHEPIGKYAREIRQLERENVVLKNKLEHLQDSKELIQTYLSYSTNKFPLIIDLPSGSTTFDTKTDLLNWIPGGRQNLVDEISNAKNKFDDNEYRIKQRKEDKVQFEKDLQEKKKKQESYPGEKDALEKKLKDKKEELDGKKKSFEEKKKDISEALKNMLGDSYGEMFIKMNTVAGEWQGEQIKTGEQLMEKRLHEYQVDRYISIEGKINKDQLKSDFNTIKNETPGEGIAAFGAQELASLYSDPLTSPEVKRYLDSIAHFIPSTVRNAPPGSVEIEIVNGKHSILNEEKFNSLSTKLTGEMLALQVAKNPNKLKDIFSKDEVLARVFSGDVLPKMIEQAFKENKYAKGLPGFENITAKGFTDILKSLSGKQIGIFMAILLASGILLKTIIK